MIGLTPAHLKKVKKVLSGNVPEYGVMVYGARAQGKASTYSYLDLAIMTDKPLPEPRLKKLTDAFAAASLPFRVETVDWASTGSSYRKEIQRTAVVLQPPPKN